MLCLSLTVLVLTLCAIDQSRGFNVHNIVGSANRRSKHFAVWSKREAAGADTKRILFIRHGRTFMNDLIHGVQYGQPGFTDIFPESKKAKYHDSPLCPTGEEQVENLHRRFRGLYCNENVKPGSAEHALLEELDLVLVSPLTRALQTMKRGLYDSVLSSFRKEVPIVALTLAAERVYMVSDWGKTRGELRELYPYVDFDQGFPAGVGEHDAWHYVPSVKDLKEYEEWRPHGEGQVYAGLGEPQETFDKRMTKLYRWMESREEQTIALVCHAGVIHWFLGDVFENCEMRVVQFAELRPARLLFERGGNC